MKKLFRPINDYNIHIIPELKKYTFKLLDYNHDFASFILDIVPVVCIE